MNIKEIGKSLILPFIYLLFPSKTGTEKSLISIFSAATFAILVSILTFTSVFYFNSQNIFGKDQQDLFLFGAILFPIAISLIGLILHLVCPAHEKELRLLRMVALPWNCLSAASILLFALTLVQSLYIVVSGLQAPEIEELTKSVSLFNRWIMIIVPLNIFWNGLSNIRKTSKLRNSGDAIIIVALLSIPSFFI